MLSVAYEPVPGEPFWLLDDVRKSHPGDMIFDTRDYVREGGGFRASTVSAPETAWFVVEGRWMEPRKAPANASVRNAVIASSRPDARLIYADGGSVRADAGTIVPPGATLKSGSEWAAITVGGRDTLHLMPGSEAVVDYNGDAKAPATRINLKTGGLFSKIERRRGGIQDYKIATPQGISAARGTDFVTLALPDRIEVWIAEGVVDVFDKREQLVGTVASADDSALKVLRHPRLRSEAAEVKANTAIMTTALGFIERANTSWAGIARKKAAGEGLDTFDRKVIRDTIPVRYLVKARRIEL